MSPSSDELDASLDEDDDETTPPPLDPARAAWLEANRAKRIAKRIGREVRDRGIHLFGRSRVLGPADPKERGLLGRLEDKVDSMGQRVTKVEVWADRLDKVHFKIIAAATVSGVAGSLIIALVKWALER